MGNLCPSEVAHCDPQETSAPTNAGGGKDPHIDGPIFVKDAKPLKSQRDQASGYRGNNNVREQASEYRESKNVEQNNQQGIQAPTNPVASTDQMEHQSRVRDIRYLKTGKLKL